MYSRSSQATSRFSTASALFRPRKKKKDVIREHRRKAVQLSEFLPVSSFVFLDICCPSLKETELSLGVNLWPLKSASPLSRCGGPILQLSDSVSCGGLTMAETQLVWATVNWSRGLSCYKKPYSNLKMTNHYLSLSNQSRSLFNFSHVLWVLEILIVLGT